MTKLEKQLLALLREGEDIISGLEADATNADLDLEEVRDWWVRAYMLITPLDGESTTIEP
jgi:hypothetical protein